ncbi:hypothetical protein LguiB_031846 [Lonicera macranthoides]
MGTELADCLTPEENNFLSRLNPEITEWKEKLIACRKNRIEIETRKAELETNLLTNLAKRTQELEAIKSSEEPKTLHSEAELKRQELRVTELLAEDVTHHLKSETFDAFYAILSVCLIQRLEND